MSRVVPDIVFERVSKSYGSHSVLNDIEFSLSPGEFFAILGPSGSGKSTLLNLIAGFEQPTKGDLLIRGRSVIRLPPHARRVGVVFQSYALFPHLNVSENLAYPLTRKHLDQGEAGRRIAAMLKLMRLEPLATAAVSQISGGQQQRVAIARALIAEPDVLLMDEPMAALDKALRDELQVELKILQKRLGTTVVYITHDQREAMALADRIGVLNNGRFEQIGTPREIYDHPASSFVARFIGGSTLILGLAREVGGHWILETSNGLRLPGQWASSCKPLEGPAQLSISPAKVRIAREEPNSIPAQVTASLYTGDSTIVHLLIGGAIPITAREAGWSDRSTGEVVSISWDPSDAIIFDSDLRIEGTTL
ncbi:ABC transporter ATP-binding protein [Rhizobium sp. Rhizsp82]|uniref:ABC transporter ATP-binding protein n=1 Tax=Rhizobium sp. Rhizsp82 TaxID=3243057 RepID=UPI0039B62DB8